MAEAVAIKAIEASTVRPPSQGDCNQANDSEGPSDPIRAGDC